VEGEFTAFGAVLKQDCGLGVLKNSVAGGVAGLELLLDLGGEVVGGVFGFPPAAGETEFVADGAVGHNALAAGVSGEFGHEGPAALFGRFVEEGLKGTFKAELVAYLLLRLEVLKVLEIHLDDRITGGQFEHRLLCIVSGREGVLFASAASICG